MKKYNAKQWGLIIGSLIVAFVIQFVMWLLIMGHPDEIGAMYQVLTTLSLACLLYTSPSPRDGLLSRMPSSA